MWGEKKRKMRELTQSKQAKDKERVERHKQYSVVVIDTSPGYTGSNICKNAITLSSHMPLVM